MVFNKTYNKFLESMNPEIQELMDLHDFIKKFLDARDYEGLSNWLMSQDLDSKSISWLKTVLIITKSFKNDEILKDIRQSIVDKTEEKLGHKLI